MTSPGAATVRRRVLSDDVVEHLIDMILNGTFQPGEKIVELQAAKALDGSQATVREALRELEAQGFLESRPFRGTYVRKFTLEGLEDYFRTRTELEVLAVRWSAESAFSKMDGTYLKECLFNMRRFVDEQDHVAFRKKDMEFHRAIVQGSGSDSLAAAWSALNHSYWAYFGLHFEQAQYNLRDQLEKHRVIYDILFSGDSNMFMRAITAHYVDIGVIVESLH